MKVLACDGIHEDGLGLFRDTDRDVEASLSLEDSAALAKALQGVDAFLVRSSTAVSADVLSDIGALRMTDRAEPEARLGAMPGIPVLQSL